MKLIALSAAATLLIALSAQANLVSNGDFESGTLGPWTGINVNVTDNAADVHGGTYAAELTALASTLTQNVAVSGGQTYLLDFWAKANGPGVLTIGLDSAPSIFLDSPPSLANGYQEYHFLITPAEAGDLSFSWNDNNVDDAFIDDVSLVAVPEPSTVVSGAILLLAFGMTAVRLCNQIRARV
jgi:hypothetical protein